jgi:hypothetical protein
MSERHKEIADYTQLVIGMIPNEFETLDSAEIKEMALEGGNEMIGCSIRTISAYDPSVACNVALIHYAALTSGATIESHYAVGLYWDDETIPVMDIDLEEGTVWVKVPDGSATYEEVDDDNTEVISRTLGALACLADSLI